MFRTDVIRHVAFEDLGLWEAPLAARGPLRYLDAGLDDLDRCLREPPDLLVVLGGPIGVYDVEQYPFLAQELSMLRQRLNERRPVLGICLGAQLMAAALGARVYPSGVKEIGWGPITLTPAGRESCLKQLAASNYTVLHWHGDTFDLPPEATLLASTELVKHQAFSIGRHALALQFHVEADPRKIESWLIGHTCELGIANLKPNELRAATAKLAADHRDHSVRVLQDWLAQLR